MPNGCLTRRAELTQGVGITLTLCWTLLAQGARAQTIAGNFESGNVDSVTQVGPGEYDLEIRPDTGASNRQWFYFTVAGAGGQTLTFHLRSFDISAPWAAGMTPCVSDDISDDSSWSRVPPAQTSYAAAELTFSFSFASNQLHHFAYSFVYTASRAQALVSALAQSAFAQRRVIGQTLQGRDIELLEITEGNAPGKLGLWIQARQHPAECGSSWTCEALLQWLVGSSPEAQALRRGALLRVLPMMNPDGVALGNYRRNSLGLDLNREWDDATPTSAPSVAAALGELADLEANYGLDLFLDLHTHSSMLQNWVYGVDGDAAFDLAEQGWPQELEATFSDFSSSLSSYSNGSGQIAKNQIHLSYGQTLSYTHEQTYHTISYGPNAGLPITVGRYRTMGQALGESLVSFFGLPLDPWVDLGQGLAGSHGVPLNAGQGTLLGGAPFSITLSNALENSSSFLVFGLQLLNAPFKGGLLLPDPTAPGFVVPLLTGADGTVVVADSWPQGVPSAFSSYTQWWLLDPLAPLGFAASNGLSGTTP